ncbi:MAG TPA: peptide ABC transporter substrate-binding protein [Chloroflexota bacterium]|jgi:peptide/nickel transport system substrate-binding protein|nr:peptide ABC transporter substrate-binding protein [Chloroflexota bacterium]
MRDRLPPPTPTTRWHAFSGIAAALLLATACGPATAPSAPPATSVPPTTAAKPTTAASAPVAATPAPAAAKPTTAAASGATPAAAGSATIGKPMEPMQPASGNVKDTLVVSMGQFPDTLHPGIGSMAARTAVLYAVFTYPITNDNRGEYVPIGVEQVPTIDNGGATFVGNGEDKHLEVTFKIKDGVKWQDGVPTTSKDIAYAWKLELDPKFPATGRTTVAKIAGIDTPDDKTAVVRYMSAKQARDAAQNGAFGLEATQWADYKDQQDPLTDPYYFLPPLLNNGLWLPEHILSKIPPEQQQAADWSSRPVGNGPYKVVDVVPNQSITLQAVDDYVLGKVPTKTVVFRIITDTNATLAALQAGEIDVTTSIQGPDVDVSPELDRLQGYKPNYIAGTSWEHIDLNLTVPALQDKNVRKALIQSIDRQQIVDKLLFGKTSVATSWIQPGIPPWAYDLSCVTPYAYDLNAATQLFQQAGYNKGADGMLAKNGQPLTLKLTTTDASLRKNVAQVMQAQLKQAGVNLDLEFMPATPFFAREGPLIQGSFDLGMYTWVAAPDPGTTLYRSVGVPEPANGLVGQNYPRYKSPQYDQVMTQAANELAIDKRKPLYCQAVKIWTDDVPVIPLFQRTVTSTARANMVNFRPTATGTPETWNMWSWFVPAG